MKRTRTCYGVCFVSLARSFARKLRQHISREVFKEINLLYLSATRAPHTAGMRPFTASVKQTVAAIVGLFDNTVLLNEGRGWLRYGLIHLGCSRPVPCH